MSHEYFFELLAEEIPAWMLPHPTLERSLVDLCKTEFGLETGGLVETGATSRRIYFVIRALPDKQADRRIEVKGPPLKVAFDAEGKPTKALEGFLKKNDASLSDVTKDAEYVRLEKTVVGRSTREILSERIPAIVEALRWPKMMRWGSGEQSFIRPVHSVISILDGQHLPITIFGLRSGETTEGHRVLDRHTHRIASFDDYVKRLREAKVVVRAAEREGMLRKRARELAAEAGGVPREDESIWDQWRYLTEWPGLVRAEFPKPFLELPEEVLITVMRVHQKQLPIIRDGKLTNSFLSVTDNVDDRDGNAAAGNSFVTNARFADARFFRDTDRKRTLESRLDDLSHLQFQEKLGDYEAKTDRIVRIATAICAKTGRDGNDVIRAATLCKSDLVTEMVKEFTELQGQIGGIYARDEGLPEVVWQAIYDHYLPVSADDPLPRGDAGAIVGLADRIDTLCGFFRIGAKPTGSKDPFALRRAAQGVVQILLNSSNWRIDLGVDALVDIAIEVHGGNAATVREDLTEFLGERVRTLLEAAPWSFAYDEVAAAMAAGWTRSLPDLVERCSALRAIRNEPGFLSILDSAKRIANIIGDVVPGEVSPSLFEHETERRLHELSGLVRAQIEELAVEARYGMALESFAGMAPELEQFFDDVMVMVEDEKVKRNRMALLGSVGRAARRIADVTKIVVDRKELQGK